MELKATLYDIIGYMFSGILLMAIVLFGSANIIESFDLIYNNWFRINSLKFPGIVCLLGSSYLLGHIISSVSSLIIEKWLCKGIDNQKVIAEDLYECYKKKFENIYKIKPNPKNFRLCICHVESKHPQVYSTAFVFQCFYGMARNVTMLFFIFGVWELLFLFINLILRNSPGAYYACLCASFSVPLSIVMFYIYKRFIKYYRQHIICGFLLEEDKS